MKKMIVLTAGLVASLAFAAKPNGKIVAWGRNTDNQCAPIPGNASSGVIAISAGNDHSLALKNNGTVVAWGSNEYNQRMVPAAAQSGVIAIAAGFYHNLALKNNGTVVAWGRNGNEQCTVPVAAQSGVIAIAAGGYHSLALKNNGTVVAWGNDFNGQCTVPTGLSGVTAIAAGDYHSLALKNNGTVVAWGNNSYNQRTVPAAAQSGVIAIAGGGFHSLALVSTAYLAEGRMLVSTPPAASTTYDGFLYDANNIVRGTLTLTAKPATKSGATTWSLTAKAMTQTATLSFSLKNSATLNNATLTAKGGETLTVSLGGDVFYGKLTGGPAALNLNATGSRNIFANSKDAAAKVKLDAVRGVYNCGLSEDGVMQGYVTLTVGNLGAVKIAGKLTDGTAFSGSVKLLSGLNFNGWYCVALHRPLYVKRGFIGGLLWINPVTKSVVVDEYEGWGMAWESADPRKGLFKRSLYAGGGRYGDGRVAPQIPAGLKFTVDMPAGLPAPAANLSGGAWMAAALPKNLAVEVKGAKASLPRGAAPKKEGAAYDYSGVNPSTATLTYTVKSGLFKGTFKMYYDTPGGAAHKAVTVSYSGVMMPFLNTYMGVGSGVVTLNKVKFAVPVWLLP